LPLRGAIFVAAIGAGSDRVHLRRHRPPDRRVRVAFARGGGVLQVPLLLRLRARHPLAQLRVVGRGLYRALFLGRLPFPQRGVDIAEVEAGDAQPEVRDVDDDFVARPRGARLVGHLREAALQRIDRGLVVLRPHRVHAAVVVVPPLLRRRRRKGHGQQDRGNRRAPHRPEPSSRGSAARSALMNSASTICSSPARNSMVLVIGLRKAGLEKVISYLPGARSSGAGVTSGAVKLTSFPVARSRIRCTCAQGKALIPRCAVVSGGVTTGAAATAGFTGTGGASGFLRRSRNAPPTITTITIAIRSAAAMPPPFCTGGSGPTVWTVSAD